MNLWKLDVQVLQLLDLRIRQLKSYRGTPDELPDDTERLAVARNRFDAHLVSMVMYQLNMAHDAVCAMS